MDNVLLLGDCLELMKDIPDQSIDLVLTDPPYGTTACKWDSIIPFEPMWKELKRIRKKDAAICLFGSEPFSSYLRISNIDEFKYDWIWEKSKVSGFMQAKNKPLTTHEVVSIFTSASMAPNFGTQPKYYPDLQEINKKIIYDGREQLGKRHAREYNQTKTGYPKSILKIASEGKTVHPTQKPVELLEYLIKTYTNESELVLDFTMGSGSTGVACKNLNRDFIGIEKDDKHFEIAKQRIEGTNET